MMVQFKTVCDEIIELVAQWESRLAGLPDSIITDRRNSQNRSIKQIVGHMVDSATNNTHRIIHLQYQPSPCTYPDYANLGNNDRWIALQNYQQEDWTVLIDLWRSTNLHIVHVIKNINPEKLDNEWISAVGQKVTLEAMVIDYLRHFKLHLEEIEALLDI